MHSLYLDSFDAEQTTNLWNSRLNGQLEDPSLLIATTTSCQLGDTYSVPRNDSIVRQDLNMILSPSPPPQPDEPMQGADATTPPDPRVASLKVIFPDFDDAVILSVLESTNNDHDRALDALLGMNDPSFVPPNPPSVQSPRNEFQPAPSTDAQRLSQETLDEQLARRLALEEQQAASQSWQPQAMEGQTMYQPYQSRRGARHSWGSQSLSPPQTQGQVGRDTMSDLQEGFSRIAESGKKTFSSIVSKVRSKMQEFDQSQGWPRTQNPPSNRPPQPASGSYSSYAPGQHSGHGAYAQPTDLPSQMGDSRPGRTSTYMSSPPRSGVLRAMAAEPAQSASPQQPSYYDPNTRGYDLYGDDEDIQINDRATSSTPPAAPTAPPSVQRSATPPRVDNPTTPPPSSDTSSPPSYKSPVSSPPNSVLSSTNLPVRSLSPTVAAARSSMTPGTPGGVDFSKLGLLPKRPISLVRPQSPHVGNAGGASSGATAASVSAPRVAVANSESTTTSSTDREEPEFIENPFEDPRT